MVVMTRNFLASIGRNGFATALFAGAATAGFAPAADGDLWWHLAAGREMVRRGELLGARTIPARRHRALALAPSLSSDRVGQLPGALRARACNRWSVHARCRGD